MVIQAVIFDIDGTLTPYGSWTKPTEGLTGSPAAHEKIHADFRCFG